MKNPSAFSTRVILGSMAFRGRHGILPEERKLGGRFTVDIEVDVEAPARYTDSLSETADYRAFYSSTKRIIEGKRFRTLEALAAAISGVVMRSRRVRGARVRVAKDSPPLGLGTVAAVEIGRGSLKR